MMVQDAQETYHSFVDFLEHDIDGIGFIVPQQLYIPRHPSSRAEVRWKQYRPPAIDFKIRGGRLGISLQDVLQMAITPNKNVPLEPPPPAYSTRQLPIDTDLTFNIQIMWPGYKPYQLDYSACLYKVENADDLKSLAIHIVHIVNYFFFDNPPERVEGQWNGWDNLQRFKDNQDKVYLLRLISVSALYWQPVFAIADDMFMPQ